MWTIMFKYTVNTASIGIATLSWWGGLSSPVTSRAMLAGVSYPWRGHPCQTGRRLGARRRVIPLALQVRGWAEGWYPSPVKRIITETRSRINSLFQRGTVAVPHRRELMTHGSQNQQDASGLIKPLIHPKYTMKIGNWNVRTYSRERNARGRLEVMGGGMDRSNQSRGVEKLSEGPICHAAQRG